MQNTKADGSNEEVDGQADCVVAEEAATPIKPEDFVHINGMRLVKPYYFDFKCNVKQRMQGKNIIDIFTQEFPARTREYYEQAFRRGRLRVEGRPPGTDMTAKLGAGTCMRHFVHRHEPPVPDLPVQVVAETPDIVAVCKPAGMPVHTAGQYRKNTVLGVLEAERSDIAHLWPTHRLDKPVSGLLLFSRSSDAANRFRLLLQQNGVTKRYLARVMGEFPEGAVVADVALTWDSQMNHATCVTAPAAAATAAAAAAGNGSSEQHQRQQLFGDGGRATSAIGAGVRRANSGNGKRQGGSRSKKRQLADRYDADAPKEAVTEFVRLRYDPASGTSLVECRPKTGRTHQIRAHLQHLGHPIANDTQYGGQLGPVLPLMQVRQARRDAAAATAGGAGDAIAGGACRTAGPTTGAAVSAQAAAAGPAGVTVCGADGAVHEEQLLSNKRVRQTDAGAFTAVPSEAAVAPTDAGSAEQSLPLQADGDADSSLATSASVSAAAAAAVAQPQCASDAEAPVATDADATNRDVDVPAPSTSASSDQATAATSSASAAPHAIELLPRLAATVTLPVVSPELLLPPDMVDPLCANCPTYPPSDHLFEPDPIWLHCSRYSSSEWDFTAPLPLWAEEGWVLPVK